MTDYSEILSRRFAGRLWTMSGNDPATLVFSDAGPILTVSDLDPLWLSVEAEIADEAEEGRVINRLLTERFGSKTGLMHVLEALVVAIKTGNTTKLDAISAKVQEIRAEAP